MIDSDYFDEIERRAAIDVGSGSTKVCIADIDVRTNRVVQVVFEHSFAVPYQTFLEKDDYFNEVICQRGIQTFTEIREILEDFQVDRVAAVATEAFRKSPNGTALADQVRAITGIPLEVISQEEEGSIAFYSAVEASKKEPDEVLIWDIGTGSFQIAADDGVYMKSFGSVPFKNYMIEVVQGKDASVVGSPNPISEEDWKKADAFAREMGRKALPLIKDKVRLFEGNVVGIGRLFANSVGPVGEEKGTITRDDLRAFIRESLNKTDDELNDPYANVNVTNCILVLGVMKALHIHSIEIMNTTSTKGILTYAPYWETPALQRESVV